MAEPRTWILTRSPENHAATAERGYTLIGMKERRRRIWRFECEPELVLDEEDWLPAEELKRSLEHVRKWPAEHWTLAFQGQLRTVSERDARVLLDAMGARAGAGALAR